MKAALFFERALRALGILVAVHGAVFALASAFIDRFGDAPDAVAEIYFFAVSVPAMILATPFSALLWRFHLVVAPGWFAWPTLAGFVLVYLAWTFALLGASVLARMARSGTLVSSPADRAASPNSR